MRNDSAEKVRFQIGVFEWDQTPRGEMLLNPTDDLIFYPNLLVIDAGEERNIRVGSNKSIVASEKSYRIFVEELPPVEKSDLSGIRILTKMGIPVFIQPAKQSVQGQVAEVKISETEFSFEIRNARQCAFFSAQYKRARSWSAGGNDFGEPAAALVHPAGRGAQVFGRNSPRGLS